MPGAAARCHTVGGVTDEEGPPDAEPHRQLAGRVERPDALDPRLQLGETGTDADLLGVGGSRIEVRRVLDLGRSVDPPVTATGRQEQAGRSRPS